MNENEWLANRFEENRGHLRAVAYRMLGSLSEADDAVQESWLRLSRSGAGGVENLSGWLTTVVGHVCLDMLRSRKARREAPIDALGPEPATTRGDHGDPEQEALLADSVGLALLVVLETLAPAERLVFVLHDMFAVPFDEIAPLVGRSSQATRQLASRARRRVQRPATNVGPVVTQQRAVVDAFLSAARRGDFDALLALLDPDVVLRMDGAASRAGTPVEIRGASAVVPLAARGRARAAQTALVNGAVGVVVAPRGRLLMVLKLGIVDGRIVSIDSIADPERLGQMELVAFEN